MELCAKEAAGRLARNEQRHAAYQEADLAPGGGGYFDADAPLARAGATRSAAGAPTERPVLGAHGGAVAALKAKRAAAGGGGAGGGAAALEMWASARSARSPSPRRGGS